MRQHQGPCGTEQQQRNLKGSKAAFAPVRVLKPGDGEEHSDHSSEPADASAVRTKSQKKRDRKKRQKEKRKQAESGSADASVPFAGPSIKLGGGSSSDVADPGGADRCSVQQAAPAPAVLSPARECSGAHDLQHESRPVAELSVLSSCPPCW